MSEPAMYSEREPNLATAWARAFLAISRSTGRELSPFLISIAADPKGQPAEDVDLRHALDACLEEADQQPVETVAKTIFPQAMWRRAGGERQKLYKSYLEFLPDFVAMAPPQNSNGLYFARLIGYGTDPKNGEPEAHLKGRLERGGNQIEFIINACKPGAMRMALQASIYDPVRDQIEARQHFPCLQHIAFVPDFNRKTLSLNAFYAMQLFFVKAYGNWLGLMRLGAFVASQTNLRFERLNCFAGIQKVSSDTRPKPGEQLERLTDLARNCVGETNLRAVEVEG
ncbi:MAG: thymidylate synthase [Isosphaeraceae bacterium]